MASTVFKVLAVVQFIATFLLFFNAWILVGPPPMDMILLVLMLSIGVPYSLWMLGEWLE